MNVSGRRARHKHVDTGRMHLSHDARALLAANWWVHLAFPFPARAEEGGPTAAAAAAGVDCAGPEADDATAAPPPSAETVFLSEVKPTRLFLISLSCNCSSHRQSIAASGLVAAPRRFSSSAAHSGASSTALECHAAFVPCPFSLYAILSSSHYSSPPPLLLCNEQGPACRERGACRICEC